MYIYANGLYVNGVYSPMQSAGQIAKTTWPGLPVTESGPSTHCPRLYPAVLHGAHM